jgi:integrase
MLYRLVRPMRRKDSRNGYFQQRIPADVRPLAIGRTLEFQVGGETVSVPVTERSAIIKFSLRSSDPAQVKLRLAEAASQAELHWKALRQAEPVILTHRQCVALARRAYEAWTANPRRETTTAMVAVPGGPLKPGEAAKGWRWEPARDTADAQPEAWGAAARSVDEDKVGTLANRLLLSEGIRLIDDASRDMLHAEIAKALRLGFDARKRNAEGDYAPDPMAGRFPAEFDRGEERRPSTPSPKGRVSLMALVEDWWREASAGSMSLSTYESYRNTARKLGAFLKHDDAARITTEDVIRFKDWRIAEGVSPWTVKANDIAGLRTVFGFGVANKRLATNPSEGVKVAGSKRPKMRDRGFTTDEASALLTQASRYVAPKAEYAKTVAMKRWAPWLCAYTGARVGEIAQLRKQDVRRDDALGAIVITITPEAGTVKDKEVREVVLHAHLEELGFWQFVERSKDGYLFLNLAKGEDMRGKWRTAKNRLREFARKAIPGKGVSPNHGWRHTFKTIGREVGIEDSVLDAICGHARSSVGRAYGGVSIAAQKRAFERFPRFAVEVALFQLP